MPGWNLRKNGWWLALGSIAVALGLWQIVAAYIVRDPFVLPSFSAVALALIDLTVRGPLLTDLYISIYHFAIGLVAALLIGVPIGILMGWFKEIDTAVNPLIEVLRPIPPLAWIPFAIVWFGLTHQSAGFVIFIGAVFPILINTYTGFRNVPKVFVEAGRMLGCTRNLALIRYIALPASVPSIAAGIRIGTGVGWMCLVAAELFGVSNYGLGKNMWHYYYLHQMDNVVVYMVVLGVLGLLIDMVFRFYVDRRLLRWREGEVL